MARHNFLVATALMLHLRQTGPGWLRHAVNRFAPWALLAGAFVLTPADAEGIPYFARKYNVTCGTCHVSVPRLNDFGLAFIARGYAMPEGVQLHRTIPVALWASGRADSRPPGAADHVRAYFNRLEAISGGKVVVPWLSYFAEWRIISRELRGDGTIRDRSGRFEDLFVTANRGSLDVTVGQFRQLQQIDVSRRLGISEPLSLAASVAGSGSGSARIRSLRSFAPAARSPAVRAAWNLGTESGRWTVAAAVPFSGELSIPLTDSARVEASNELELRRKGIFLETFLMRGQNSAGVHFFYDDADRYLGNFVGAGRVRNFYFTGIAGIDRVADVTRGRWSAEGEYIPHLFLGLGARVENRAADAAEAAFLPYVNFNFPSTRYTFRLTLERRFQQARNGTFFEFGTVF